MIYKKLDWMDIDILCYNLYRKMKIKNYKPDCIIALLRGGLVPARILEDHFDHIDDFYTMGVKLYNNDNMANERIVIKEFNEDLSNKNVLIVDDIWDSGKTMRCVKSVINSLTTYSKSIRTATLLCREDALGRPEYYGELIDKSWIVFPWENYEHQRHLDR